MCGMIDNDVLDELISPSLCVCVESRSIIYQHGRAISRGPYFIVINIYD